ncbi:hypothetical protein BHE74_00026521 [Ensete ventricosum]|nr:hypothetical protein GW17_00023519 [Ensete ventricosum]RWW66132.1 hypothetical protein BHE74_00026521 [Ensete ventricosum]RZS04512.1 hypothetical protein BHM03_00034847 [Ensete ventricosum]
MVTRALLGAALHSIASELSAFSNMAWAIVTSARPLVPSIEQCLSHPPGLGDGPPGLEFIPEPSSLVVGTSLLVGWPHWPEPWQPLQQLGRPHP